MNSVTIRNLGLAIALTVLIPTTVYWAMRLINPHPVPEYLQNPEEIHEQKKYKNTQEYESKMHEYQQWQQRIETYQKINFITYIVAGVIVIVIGALSSLLALGVRFVLSGIALLVMAIVHHHNQLAIVFKFSLFFIALFLVIFLLLYAERQKK